MEINNLIEKLGDVFEETDLSTLTPNTVLREIEEWSSLSALSLIALADEEYDVEISGNDLKNITTVQDLFDLIQSK